MRRGFKLFTKLLIISLIAISLFGCNKKEETVAVTEVDTQETYRVITVSTLEGSAYVKHSDGQIVNAFEGMNLYDGDVITVGDNSNMVIDADSDKHMLAEAGTRFWLTAEGTEEHNNTKINLEKGSVLCQITEKLEDGESFDVVTASSTMCVRGTVFRVSNIGASDSTKFDMVEVYDGKVWSNINDSEEEVTLEPGQCALIKNSDENNSASYVSANQIDAAHWTTGDMAILLNEEEADGNAVLPIAYNKLSSAVVNQLIEMSNEGQELCFDSEKLNEISESVTQRDTNTGKASSSSTDLLVSVPGTVDYEHRSNLNDHICAEYGHVIMTINGVRKCAYCGLLFSDDYVETDMDTKHAKEFADETGIALEQKWILPEGAVLTDKGGFKMSFNSEITAKLDDMKKNENGSDGEQNNTPTDKPSVVNINTSKDDQTNNQSSEENKENTKQQESKNAGNTNNEGTNTEGTNTQGEENVQSSDNTPKETVTGGVYSSSVSAVVIE